MNTMMPPAPTRYFRKKVYVLVYSDAQTAEEAVDDVTRRCEGSLELKEGFEAVVKVVDMKTNKKELGADILI